MNAPDTAPPPRLAVKKGTLAAVVGLVTASLLLTQTPKEESGRTVKVTMAPDGTATVRHVSGKHYLQAYLDIVGVATICDGLTSIEGRRVTAKDKLTENRCAVLLEKELVTHAEGVMQCTPGLALTIPRRDYVRFAAVSLAYNVGVANWCGSTARRLINAGDVRGSCNALLAWNKGRIAGKLVVIPGLTARRGREQALCLKDAA